MSELERELDIKDIAGGRSWERGDNGERNFGDLNRRSYAPPQRQNLGFDFASFGGGRTASSGGSDFARSASSESASSAGSWGGKRWGSRGSQGTFGHSEGQK